MTFFVARGSLPVQEIWAVWLAPTRSARSSPPMPAPGITVPGMPISARVTTPNDVGVNARGRIGPGPWYNAKGALIATNVADLHGDQQQRDRNAFARTTRWL